MSKPDQAVAGAFVTRRGDAWATGLAAGLGGLVGAAAEAAADKRSAGGAASLERGALAYLAVLPESVVVFRAKRGALKPKALDDIVVEVPRAEVQRARYKKGMAVGVFELEFADGSTWAFDVGRAFAKSAGQVAAALGATVD